MPGDEVEKYFRALELGPRASLREIHNSYLRLKKLYSAESIVLAPLGEEFSEKDKKEVLRQIEEAYAKLLAFKKEDPAATEKHSGLVRPPGDSISDSAARGGEAGPKVPFLRTAREKAEVDLERISDELKLRIEVLKNLEEERFNLLPEETYLRGHLKAYALIVGLDPDAVIGEYLRRYQAWKNAESPDSR
jgi:hypothetical protein